MPEEVREENHLKDKGHERIYLSKRRIMIHNFLGGLAWGFGTVLGGTIVVALVLLVLSQLETVPLVGDFIKKIINQINDASSLR